MERLNKDNLSETEIFKTVNILHFALRDKIMCW